MGDYRETIRLHGGPCDGQTMTIKEPLQQLRAYSPLVSPATYEPVKMVAVKIETITYQRAGEPTRFEFVA